MTNVDFFQQNTGDGSGNNDSETRDFFSELVGDDKRFKTPQDLAKSKVHGDDHINKLETELASLREDLKARLTLEEFADQLSSIQDNIDSLNNNRNTNDDFNNDGASNKSALTPEEIDSIVESKLDSRITDSRRQANASYALKEMKETFGEKYSQRIKEESERLGLGKEFVNNLAAEQPQAFLKIFGENRGMNDLAFTTPPKGNLPNHGPVVRERTEAYYNQLRDKDPVAYWSPKVQNQLHKDALDLGERFFDISGA